MNIKELRQLKGVTQGEVADKLNITAQVVSRYENNLREPDLQTLCALADYFGVSIDTLVGHTPVIAERSAEEQLMLDVACMSEESKDKLRSLLFGKDVLEHISHYKKISTNDRKRLDDITAVLEKSPH